jgi:hypothetical protein
MIQSTYTLLYGLAAVGTVASMIDLGPRRYLSAGAAILWLGLIPSSWAVETVTNSGSVETIAQPTLGFLAVAGLGVALVSLVIDVIAQLRPRRDPSRVISEVLR